MFKQCLTFTIVFCHKPRFGFLWEWWCHHWKHCVYVADCIISKKIKRIFSWKIFTERSVLNFSISLEKIIHHWMNVLLPESDCIWSGFPTMWQKTNKVWFYCTGRGRYTSHILNCHLCGASKNGSSIKLMSCHSVIKELSETPAFETRSQVNENSKSERIKWGTGLLDWFGLVSLMAYQLFLGYLMPKPFS